MVQGSDDFKGAAVEATASRAVRKRSGNTFPRRSARRRIPAHAFGLKKYRSGGGVVTKTADKEDTLAALGQSEELSVQHSPRHAIPELRHCPDDGAKGSPSVNRENSGDVLPHEPARANRSNQFRKFKSEVTALVREPPPEPGG